MSAGPSSARAPRSILLIRLRGVGDVLLALPCLTALREAFPEATLGAVVDDACADVARGHPALDRLHVRPRRALAALPPLARARGELAFLREVRAAGYDAAIDLFGNLRSALLAKLSGAGVRVGWSVRFRRLLYTDVVPRARSENGADVLEYAVLVNQRALAPLGVTARERPTTIALGDAERARGKAAVAEVAGQGAGPVVCLCPTATWPTKAWPLASFAALGRRLASEAGARIVVAWGPGEREAAETVARAAGTGALLPGGGLRDLAAELAACDLLVTNDSGPKHLAVAVGTPTLTLFGPTAVETWHVPGDPRHVALRTGIACSPCDLTRCPTRNECLRDLSPDAAFEAARSLLARWPEARALGVGG